MTQIYDMMCQERILICLNVKLPPVKDEQCMYQNQDKLRVLIARFDNYLASNIIDIFTSRHELGSVSETTAYVRFPHYSGDEVENIGWADKQSASGHTHATGCDLL